MSDDLYTRIADRCICGHDEMVHPTEWDSSCVDSRDDGYSICECESYTPLAIRPPTEVNDA